MTDEQIEQLVDDLRPLPTGIVPEGIYEYSLGFREGAKQMAFILRALLLGEK